MVTNCLKLILHVCCLIGQGFRKRKVRTHIVSFVNRIHNRKNYKSRGTIIFVKNDTLSLNIGVILFFFEVKFLHVFVKYCLGVWENDFTDISWWILALNISKDNKNRHLSQLSENECYVVLLQKCTNYKWKFYYYYYFYY